MSEITITKENFEAEVLRSDKPALVDFWAAWCGPCRMLAPTIAKLAEEYEGKVKVCKVNIDEQQELAAQYRIDTIPTVILFKDGKAVDSAVGFVPKSQLEALLK